MEDHYQFYEWQCFNDFATLWHTWRMNHILPAILGQATRVMAMAISELTGYFYGIKDILFRWGSVSTYNWYFGP